MDVPLVVVIIVIATAAAVTAGIAFTVRGFKASAARANGTENHHTAEAAQAAVSRHDQTTTELLKRFFDGKECAICKRPIPPVHRTGLKPGLMNSKTHETHSWNEIPTANLPVALEDQLPVCSACLVAESFRQRFPDRVLDRDRPVQSAPR